MESNSFWEKYRQAFTLSGFVAGVLLAFLIGRMTLSKTEAVVQDAKNSVTVVQALSDVGEGLVAMKGKLGDVNTGLLPTNAVIEFNVSASASENGGLVVGLPKLNVNGNLDQTSASERGNVIRIEFTNLMSLLNDKSPVDAARYMDVFIPLPNERVRYPLTADNVEGEEKCAALTSADESKTKESRKLDIKDSDKQNGKASYREEPASGAYRSQGAPVQTKTVITGGAPQSVGTGMVPTINFFPGGGAGPITVYRTRDPLTGLYTYHFGGESMPAVTDWGTVRLEGNLDGLDTDSILQDRNSEHSSFFADGLSKINAVSVEDMWYFKLGAPVVDSTIGAEANLDELLVGDTKWLSQWTDGGEFSQYTDIIKLVQPEGNEEWTLGSVSNLLFSVNEDGLYVPSTLPYNDLLGEEFNIRLMNNAGIFSNRPGANLDDGVNVEAELKGKAGSGPLLNGTSGPSL